MQFRSEIRSDHEGVELPAVGIFTIDKLTAANIIDLSNVVKRNGLHVVSHFDYRVVFLKHDPEHESEEAEEAGDENNVRTDCDLMIVSGSEFWFSSELKHMDVEILTQRYSISELATHYGLSLEPTRSPETVFVDQVANLKIWDTKGQKDECDVPGDGYLDSHSTLMGMVKQARKLQKGA